MMKHGKLPKVFARFDLAISHHRGSTYRVRLDDSPDGRRAAMEVDFDWLPVLEVEDRSPDLSPSKGRVQRHLRVAQEVTEEPRQIGERLFQAVFAGSVGAAYRASVRAVRERRRVGLRVRLAFDDAPQLASLPWEALWDPTDGAFLSDQPHLVVVRTLRIAEPVPRFEISPRDSNKAPLGLLALLPAPQGEDPLSGAEEWRQIRESLEGLIEDGEVEDAQVEPPTLDAFRDRVDSHPCHVLHVVAHGLPGEPGQGGGVLCLENAHGGSDEVNAGELVRGLVGAEPPRLVVLNVCYGATNSDLDSFDGLAQTLLRRGVAAVVAMRSSISDAAAVLFATTLYRHLARGRTVEAAMVASRRALGTSQQRHELTSPVLYMLGDNVALVKEPCKTPRPTKLGLWSRRVGMSSLAGAVMLSLALGLQAWFSERGRNAGSSPGAQEPAAKSAHLGPSKPMALADVDLSPICPTPAGLQDLEFVRISAGVATVRGQPWTVEKAFCISTKEISRRDWRSVTGEEPPKNDWAEDWPMARVSLDDARRFANRLEQLKLGIIFRLPKPSEWLLAASAEAETPYFFGEIDDELHLYGNCFNFFQDDGYDGPAPVGSYRPNRFGLYDVHGNVAEWVEADDPEGKGRHLRLGGSYGKVRDCKLDKFSWVQAEDDDETGFRIVQEISPAAAD